MCANILRGPFERGVRHQMTPGSQHVLRAWYAHCDGTAGGVVADVLSASEDATLRLWDVSTAGCIRLFHGHHRAVKCAAISPDGAIAASASEDCTLRVWHLASGKVLCSLPLGNTPISPRAVCFSSNGKLLACIGEYTVGIWEVRDLTRGEDIPPPALSFKSVVPLMGASFLPNQSVLILACTELTSQSS